MGQWNRIYVPDTPLYYLHLDSFLKACAAIPSAERRRALHIYRESVDEHIAAAQDAINIMRRGEKIISNLRYVKIIPGSPEREIGWKNLARAEREMLRFGRAFRQCLNETRGALESFTFEMVTALDDVAERNGRGLGFSTRRLKDYAKTHPKMEPLARYVAQEVGTHPPRNEGYFRIDDLRQVSFHRRIPFWNLDIRWYEAGDELIGKPNSAAWLPDDPWDLHPQYTKNSTVVGTVNSGLWDVARIIDDGYAMATRTLVRRQYRYRRLWPMRGRYRPQIRG